MGKKLKSLILVLSFVFVMLTTIAYSALSTSLSFISNVKLRPITDIRVDSIKLSGSTQNGAVMQYESEYNVDRITSGFVLPNTNSSITYKVTIKNNGDIDQTIYGMTPTTNNDGLQTVIKYSNGSPFNYKDIIEKKASVDLYITYTTTTPSENVINVTDVFDFRKVYYITYQENGGSNVTDQIKYEGEDLVLNQVNGSIELPTKSGHAFQGWTDESNGERVKYTAGSSLTVDLDETPILTLYALYTKNVYEVTIDPDNGDQVTTNNIEYNASLGKLPTVSKTGYTLDGWYNGNTKVTKDTPVTSDMNIKAKWVPNTYTITLDKNGATNNPTASIETTYDSEELNPESITLPKKEYDVTISDSLTDTRKSSGAIISSTDSLKSTYNFTGWYTQTANGIQLIDNQIKPSLTPNINDYTDENSKWIHDADVKLYARFTGDGSVTLPTIEKTGYTCGWTTNQNGTTIQHQSGETINNLITNITLYGVCVPNTYTVTADSNGGSIPSTSGWSGTGNASTKTVTYDSAYGTLPTPTRNGYTFTGWNGKNLFSKDATPFRQSSYILDGEDVTNPSGEYSVYQVNIKPNTAYTITNSGESYRPSYAIYDVNNNCLLSEKYNARKYITFTTPSTASYIRFSVVTQTSSTRYDKDTFQLEEGNIATPYEPYYVTNSVKVTQTKSHNLKAIWNLVTYSVSYNLNGGSTTITNPTSYTVESESITLNNPTKTGYDFKGWSGTGLTGDTNTNVTISNDSTGNRSYTAHWTPKVLTITLDNVNATTIGTPAIYEKYNTGYYTNSGATTQMTSSANPITVPTKEGYTFEGYYTASTGGNQYIDATGKLTSVASNTQFSAAGTLYAHWTYSATPSISRSDYNTFTVSAVGGSQYLISKTQTTAPTSSTSGWSTTTSKDVSTSAKETWYVWVKDADGNVSSNNATITNYKVTLTANTGTTLNAKADTTSGTAVTSGMYVLDGTPVYPTGSLKTGYKSLVLKKGSTSITNSSSQTISADTTFTSSATPKVLTIALNNQDATTAGTTAVYEKYNTGYYTNSGATTQMTTSANPITVPTKEGYTFEGYYTAATGGNQYIDATGKLTSVASNTQFSANGTLYAHWTYSATPSITRSDLNTFTYSATSAASYIVTTTSTKPSPTATGWTTELSKDITSAGTYYVWAKDSAGNVSVNSSNIKAYTISRSTTNGTLTTEYETSGGTPFTGNIVMLAGTGVYAKCVANPGYEGATLKHGTRNLTSSGATFTVDATETVSCSASTTTYSISYNLNGGSESSSNPTSYTVESGEITLYNPTKENYAFAGWTGSNGTTPQKTVTVPANSTGNKSYTANWTYNATPSITLSDYNTFTYSAGGSAGYYVSTSSTMPAASSSGWTTSTTTGDLTLTAGQTYYVWTKDQEGNVSANKASIAVRTVTRSVGTGSSLTVKYTNSSGTNVTFASNKSNMLNGTVIYVSAGASTGYQSASLKKDNTSSTNSTTYTISANTTFTSSATPKVLTITLDNQEATTAGTTAIYEKYNTGYYTNSGATTQMTSSANPITVPTKTGYTFEGYYTTATGGNQYIDSTGKLTSVASNTQFSANGTLYAHWKIQSYTVTYNYSQNGGTSATKSTDTRNYNTAIDLTPTAIKSGWTFVGWNTDKDATTSLNSLTMATSDVILYAIYRKEAVTLTAKWDANNATLSSTTNKTCTLAEVYNNAAQATSCTVDAPTITAPTNTPTVVGFNTSASSTSNNSSYATSTGKLTLTSSLDNKTWYAITTKAKVTLTAKWNANNATLSSTANKTCDLAATFNGTAQATSCTVDAPTITAPTNTPTILGFNTSATSNANNSAYNTSTKKLTLTSSLNNKTWYAQTRKDAVTRRITFHLNGNTSFTYSGTKYTDTSKAFDLCTIAATYNGTEQGTSCSKTITFPTIEAHANTPTLIGWSTGASTRTASYTSGQASVSLTASSNLSYYAQTKKDKVTLTAKWNANNATLSSTTNKTCDLAIVYNGASQATSCTVDAPTITAPTNTPTVVGFNTSASSTSNNSSYATSTGKLTLTSSNNNSTWYAITKKAAVTLTAKWNANNATLSSTTDTTCTIAATYNGTAQGTSCTLTAPTITAPTNTPTILGFNTSATSHANNSAYNTSTKKLTLTSSLNNKTWYAQTRADAKTHTITFKKNGVSKQTNSSGTAVTDDSVTRACTRAATYNGTAQAASCKVTSPTITPATGYNVVGYNTSSTATTSSWNQATEKSISSSTTYYAIQSPKNYILVKMYNKGNLLRNYGFDNITKTTATPQWNTSLNNYNGNAYHVNEWPSYSPATITGYNSGVTCPGSGHHAHLANDGGTHGNVIDFNNQNITCTVNGSSQTVKNRWLGISQNIPDVLVAGHTYEISMDIKRISGTAEATVGLYYPKGTSTTRDFYSGEGTIGPTAENTWQRVTWTFKLDSEYKYNASAKPALYIYGHKAGKTGEFYIDNVSLSETTQYTKAYNAAYTSTELAVPEKTGYMFDGWHKNYSETTSSTINLDNWLTTSNKFNTSYATFTNVSTASTPARIYAKWVPMKYSLTIDPNGGSWGGTTSTTTTTQAYDAPKKIANPTRSNYTFTGWAGLSPRVLADGTALDPNFASSTGGVSGYDIKNNTLSVSRSANTDATKNPVGSYYLTLSNASNPAAASPGLGGFKQPVYPQSKHEYVHIIIAAFGKGMYLNIAHNSLGTGSSMQWLTDREGSSGWRVYAYKIYVGEGSPGSIGYVYFSNNPKSDGSSEQGHFSAYLGYSAMIDLGEKGASGYNNKAIGQYDDSAYLKATWSPSIYKITLNANGGTAGTTAIYEKYNTGYYLNSGATTKMTTSSNKIATLPTRTNYKFTGYYTATSGGAQYIDANGYITHTGATSTMHFAAAGTLYAHWESTAPKVWKCKARSRTKVYHYGCDYVGHVYTYAAYPSTDCPGTYGQGTTNKGAGIYYVGGTSGTSGKCECLALEQSDPPTWSSWSAWSGPYTFSTKPTDNDYYQYSECTQS